MYSIGALDASYDEVDIIGGGVKVQFAVNNICIGTQLQLWF